MSALRGGPTHTRYRRAQQTLRLNMEAVNIAARTEWTGCSRGSLHAATGAGRPSQRVLKNWKGSAIACALEKRMRSCDVPTFREGVSRMRSA